MPVRGPRAPKAPQGEPCGCSGRCGQHYDDEQVISLIISGGFDMKNVFTSGGSGKTLNLNDTRKVTTMLAITIHESNGYTQACNHNVNGTYDRGLTQINERWHQDGWNKGGASLSTYAFDYHNSWRVWQLSGRSFGAWTGYQASLPRAVASVAAYAKKHGGLLGDPGEVKGDLGSLLTGGACGNCIHCASFPFGFNICFDALLGGFKVAAGGAVLAIAGLAILYLTAREVGEATGTRGGLQLAKRAAATNPAGRAATRVYRRASSRPSPGTTVAKAQAKGRAAVARERRRTVAVRERAATRKSRYRARAAEARSDAEIAKASFRQERFSTDEPRPGRATVSG